VISCYMATEIAFAEAGVFLMSKIVITAAATFFVASTIAVSAGGIGLGIGGIGIVIGPGSVAPPREYHPSVRSYHEQPSRPRRQQRQHVDDDEKAEAATPAKSHANENSSIAALAGNPDLHRENSSIASGPQPAEPVLERGSPTPNNLHLENSSIAGAPRPAEPVQSTAVVVVGDSPAQQSAVSTPVLCSRYFATAGRTMQVPCE
jgi:hypothetical protein